MAWQGGVRAWILGVASAGALALAACAPVPTVLDTPKNGDRVSLSVEQPMTVRWSNGSPDHGAWVLESGPRGAVKLVGRTSERPPGGAFALDVFEFVGAQQGADSLTFVYRRKDGQPPTTEERITLDVAVG